MKALEHQKCKLNTKNLTKKNKYIEEISSLSLCHLGLILIQKTYKLVWVMYSSYM